MSDLDQDAIDATVDDLPDLVNPYVMGAMTADRYEIITAIVERYEHHRASGGPQ